MPRELWALSSEEMEIREYETPEPGEGQVSAVGPEVTDLQVGDRVLTYGPFREVHVVLA